VPAPAGIEVDVKRERCRLEVGGPTFDSEALDAVIAMSRAEGGAAFRGVGLRLSGGRGDLSSRTLAGAEAGAEKRGGEQEERALRSSRLRSLPKPMSIPVITDAMIVAAGPTPVAIPRRITSSQLKYEPTQVSNLSPHDILYIERRRGGKRIRAD
jgi:hypothetical protein